jgi:hypothetical protein
MVLLMTSGIKLGLTGAGLAGPYCSSRLRSAPAPILPSLAELNWLDVTVVTNFENMSKMCYEMGSIVLILAMDKRNNPDRQKDQADESGPQLIPVASFTGLAVSCGDRIGSLVLRLLPCHPHLRAA